MKKDTSWDKSADWYHELIEESGSYQKEVILPNLLRLLKPQPGQKIIDLGCGTGFFARAFSEQGALVTGIDNSADMINTAKAFAPTKQPISYSVGSADNLKQIKNNTHDAAVIILAIQNMEQAAKVLSETARVLKPGGRLYLVLNHPTFRVPKASSWEWTGDQSVQFRRIDKYLSESKQKILMHPGVSTEYTVSFHRPLQTYVKLLGKAGLGITNLEEWISNRLGPKGKTFTALEQARKEIPLFMAIEAKKL
ncbi:MAG: methyltransferase domain-containing protein [Candidatus Magasanikbacteria bacterium]|nr:methyltransferase domain-containing protein [Candidatus Magasanikbacteria bacterium]